MKKILMITVAILLMFSLSSCEEFATNGKENVDGKTPYIQDGYWYIDGTNTGVKAEGVDGTNGKDGQNGTDGKDGTDGTNGLSAYEIFLKYNPEYTGTEEEWIYAVATNNVCALFGHKEVIDEALEATCTVNGLTQGSHCGICEKVLHQQNVIEAKHNYVNNICSVCGMCSIVFTLSDDGDSYYVSDYVGNDTELIIPSTYNEKPVTKIGRMAFYSCENITTVTISNSIVSIDDSAFAYCYRLKSIEIPDSVISIGSEAFYGCVNLSYVSIGKGVTTIGEYAFNCDQLRYVFIPASVTNISSNVFYHSDNLAHIQVDYNNPNYQSIDGNLYSKDGTELIQYAPGKTAHSFIIPNSVTTIGDYAFALCYNLTDILVYNDNPNYQSIDGNLYSKDGKQLIRYALGKLKASFEIPEGVTTIDPYAFYTNYNLVSITVPTSIISIESGIFLDNLMELINKSPNVFFENDINTNAKLIYNSELLVESKLTNDQSFIIHTDGEEKILLRYIGSSTDITIPDYVTKINQYAFAFRRDLTSVTFGNNITYIGNGAFGFCSNLRSVVIPDSVTYIGWHAFDGCINLKNVTVGNGVETVDMRAFNGCSNLTDIVIGKNVTTIWYSAFQLCDNLTNIYYVGADLDWENINIPNYKSSVLSIATRYYYSENAPSEINQYWHYVDGIPTVWQ